MNVANLQLEGLLMAVASINNVLVTKGLLSIDDIDSALRKAETGLTSDERLVDDMRPANRDAVCFPIRLLRMANRTDTRAGFPSFAELARSVGQKKQSYGDQI